MSFEEYKTLEQDILGFIKRYSKGPSPETEFNVLALKIFRFQYSHNIFYRRFCALLGFSPGRVRSWKEIPAMPASAFKELVLTSFPAKAKIRVFHTSGTTLDSRGAHYFLSLRLYEASILPTFKKNLLTGSPKRAYFFLMNHPKDAPDSSLSFMMEAVNHRFARSRGRYYVKSGNSYYDDLLNDLKKERNKVLLLATAFSLKNFLDRLKALNVRLKLKKGSRLMETGGFKGKTREITKESLYRECSLRLGISIERCFSEYGMTELSSQYYCRAFGVFRGPAWVRTVLIDPRTGKEASKGRAGILKHLDLANLGSVMAVQTEDLGRETGGGFKLLGRVSGSLIRGCSLDYEALVRSSA